MARRSRLAWLSTAMLLLGGCQSEKAAAPSQAVRVEAVAEGGMLGTARATGLAKPGKQAELAFRFSGYLERIGTTDGSDGIPRPLVPGDLVTGGAMICALRSKDFEHHVAEANGMSGGAAATYAKAKEDVAQAETLYSGGVISKADLATARARYRAVVAEGTSAQARVASAKLALRDASLVAPFDGELLLLTAKVGALVGAGTPVAIVADLSTVRVVVSSPEGVQLRLGAVVRAESAGRVYSGTVRQLLPAIVGVRAAPEVEIEIDNRAGEIRPAALVHIVFDTQPNNAPTVPIEAIVRGVGGEAFSVFVLRAENDGTLERRGVSLGTFSGGRVAVTAGLRTGERVVVQGAALLLDGSKVTVVN